MPSNRPQSFFLSIDRSVALACAVLLISACCDELERVAKEITPTETLLAKEPPVWPADIASLRFGVAPYAAPQVIHDSFTPIIRHLSRRLGVPVELVVTKDYGDLIRRMRDQSIDFAELAPASYVRLKEFDPGAVLLASQLQEGAETYGGYIVVRNDDPAEKLEDLRGRTFCFPDPNSTSGYVFPRALIRKKGHDPDRFFGQMQQGGSHFRCLRRVVSGHADAAAVSSSEVAASRRAAFPLSRIKIVAKTERIPWDAYCARSGLPAQAAERLRWELLSLSTRTPDGRDVLAGPLGMNAWQPSDDAVYDVARRALRLSNQ